MSLALSLKKSSPSPRDYPSETLPNKNGRFFEGEIPFIAIQQSLCWMCEIMEHSLLLENKSSYNPIVRLAINADRPIVE